VTGRLLGREPVMTVSTVVALLIAVLPVFGWPTATVGAVAAALVLTGGAVEAALVSVDRALPLLVGVAKAVLAAVAAFGLHVPDNHVAALMAVLTVIAGLATRAQVGAVQPPVNRHGREVDRNGWVVGELDTASDEVSPRYGGEAPEGGHHTRTEVISAVMADGPLPEYRESDGEREHRARHRLRYGSHSGELRPDFGV
jgi:hypothetical protein